MRHGNIRRSTLRRRRRLLTAFAVSVLVILMAGMLAFLSHENPSSLETHHPPWRYGVADARFTLVFYADLKCPYCKDYSPQLRRWIDAHEDVNLQWHHLPLAMHEPAASEEARWVECAGRINGNAAFWSAAQWVYDHTRSNGHGVPELKTFPEMTEALQTCAASSEVANLVREQAEEALASGIAATPSLRLIDNASGQSMVLSRQIPGDVLLSAIDLLATQEK